MNNIFQKIHWIKRNAGMHRRIIIILVHIGIQRISKKKNQQSWKQQCWTNYQEKTKNYKFATPQSSIFIRTQKHIRQY